MQWLHPAITNNIRSRIPRLFQCASWELRDTGGCTFGPDLMFALFSRSVSANSVMIP